MRGRAQALYQRQVMGTGGVKRYFFLTAALVAAAAGYIWYWHATAGKIRAGIPEIVRAAQEFGFSAELAEPSVHGFPYRFVVNFPSVELGTDERMGIFPAGWRLRAEGVTGYLQPWNLSHVIVEFTKPLFLSSSGIGQTIASDRALLSLSLDGNTLRRLSLDILGGTVSSPTGERRWKVGRLQAHARRISDGIQISLKADDIEYPEPASGIPGRKIKHVHVTGALKGSTPDFEPAMEAGKGVLALDDFAISWPPVEIEGSGSLALDSKRRPVGSVKASLRGHGAFIDLLEASGVLRPGKAAMTRAALDMLQSSQGNPGGRLEVNIELAGGRLYLGPIKLMRLPVF